MFRILATAVLAIGLSWTANAMAAPKLADYGAYLAMEGVRLSPSGDRYAYTSGANDHRKLLVYSVSGDPVRGVDLGEVSVTNLQWAGDDHLILRVRRIERVPGPKPIRRSNQAMVLNVVTGNSFWVFDRGAKDHKVAQVVEGYYGATDVTGRWVGYFSGYSSRGYILWRVDLETGVEAPAVRNTSFGPSPYYLDWQVDPQGEVAALSVYDTGKSSWRAYPRAREPNEVAATPRDPPFAQVDRDLYSQSRLSGLGRTAGTVVYRTVDANQTFHYFEKDPRTSDPAVELAPGQEVEALIHDPRSGLLIGARLEGDPVRYLWFDPAVEKRFAAAQKALAGRNPMLASANAGFTRLIMYTHGDRDAGTFWFVDLVKGRADILGDAWSNISPDDINPVRKVQYLASDGLALEGILTLPARREPKRLPLVVLPHGGATGYDTPGFDWLAQAFASSGYAVFQPNYRGSAGFGEALRVAAFGEWGRKVQTDVSDGVAALAAQGLIDPGRACIMGEQLGGYIALAGVTVQHGLYRCAVSIAGVVSLVDLAPRQGSRSPAGRIWRSYLGLDGERPTSAASLRSLSPDRLADKADAPILLIDDRDLANSPMSPTIRMKDALVAAGKTTSMVLVDGDGEGLAAASTRVEVLQAAMDFVERHNPSD